MIQSFLALFCATAQQSYCHDVGVRRPSVRRQSVVHPAVDIVFLETVNWIDTKFFVTGTYPPYLQTILLLLFCLVLICL